MYSSSASTLAQKSVSIVIVRNYPANHDVAIVVGDGVAVFELGVACDVFGDEWAGLIGAPWYRSFVCSLTRGPVTTDSGFQILPDHGPEAIRSAGTVIVLPSVSFTQVPDDLLDALREAHAGGGRIVSLCTGAFALADAGLLDGRRATTHWTECAELARRYPRVSVDPGVLFVDEGDVLTSAGSAASIDLCLHVVRRDHGSDVANRAARRGVVPPWRDGGQSQYIEAPLPVAGDAGTAATRLWAADRLHSEIDLAAMAAHANMSVRTFTRRFRAESGMSPGRWLVHQRLDRARHLLETTDLPIDRVAAESGFGTATSLRQHLHAEIGVAPAAYRRTFRAEPTPTARR